MVLVMVATAVTQEGLLNKAMDKYNASVVVPTHYVLFTLFSIVGPSILYQELTLDQETLQISYPPAVMPRSRAARVCDGA